MSVQSESGRIDYAKSDTAPKGTQMAGEVIKFPGKSSSGTKYDSQGRAGDIPVKPFDPMGDMSGGGKVVKLPWVE